MSTLDLLLPLTHDAPASHSLGFSTAFARCDRAELAEDGDALMRTYVRGNLAQICVELQTWDHFSEPARESLLAHAGALLSSSWKETFNHAAAVHVVETFVRDECVAQLAATTLPAQPVVPASWRSKLFEFNTWLQVIGAGMGLLGQHYINERNPVGFVCWIVSNCALVTLQRRTKLRVLVLLHSIYLLMSFQGLYLWLGH